MRIFTGIAISLLPAGALVTQAQQGHWDTAEIKSHNVAAVSAGRNDRV